MKSTYTDNFRHSIVFVPPVYNKTVKGKDGKRQKMQIQGPVIVLKHVDSVADLDRERAAYERLYAKRPGRIVVRKADEALPHVGKNYGGRYLPKNAEVA